MTKFKMEASKIFQTYWIKYIINGIEQRMTIPKLRISFLKFKNKSMVLISGLNLFHSSIMEGKKKFLKISVLQ